MIQVSYLPSSGHPTWSKPTKSITYPQKLMPYIKGFFCHSLSRYIQHMLVYLINLFGEDCFSQEKGTFYNPVRTLAYIIIHTQNSDPFIATHGLSCICLIDNSSPATNDLRIRRLVITFYRRKRFKESPKRSHSINNFSLKIWSCMLDSHQLSPAPHAKLLLNRNLSKPFYGGSFTLPYAAYIERF